MRTKLLLSLLLLCGALGAVAQSTLVATLSHDGSMKAYYGPTALSQAHDAAVDGDVITLSGGTFTGCDITKAITLRGAGMIGNLETQTFPTYITAPTNGSTITISSGSTTHPLVMEGVNFRSTTYFSGEFTKPVFQKCKFTNIAGDVDSQYIFHSATFINCLITSLSAWGTATIINSYVVNPQFQELYDKNDIAYPSFVDMHNCVICLTGLKLDGYKQQTSFSNCIFATTAIYYNSCPGEFGVGSQVYNCVFTGAHTNGLIFKNIPAVNNNTVVNDMAAVFKVYILNYLSYSNTFYDELSLELTETAAQTYLGTDGTQVGMYGGSQPYDPFTTTLHIVKCNVASKTTADGKLPVDIEVSGNK